MSTESAAHLERTAWCDPADPATGLRAASALHRLATALEEIHVANARACGWSWQEIADALGVSRQAVHQKHAATARRVSKPQPREDGRVRAIDQ